MSEIGQPTKIVWVIREDPQDEASLYGMMIDGEHIGICLFTRREFAKDFYDDAPDIADDAIAVPVEVPAIVDVLEQQQRRGRTHVVIDPIIGSSSYLDQKTHRIEDYISKLNDSE